VRCSCCHVFSFVADALYHRYATLARIERSEPGLVVPEWFISSEANRARISLRSIGVLATSRMHAIRPPCKLADLEDVMPAQA